MELESERLLIEYLIDSERRKDLEKRKKIMENLHVYEAYLWGLVVIGVAPSKDSFIDYLYSEGIIHGFGRIDVSERVWELPSTGAVPDSVAIVCVGESGYSYLQKLEKDKTAQLNTGADI